MYVHITLAGGIFHFHQFQQFFLENLSALFFSPAEINDEREHISSFITTEHIFTSEKLTDED